jgi:glyoxylase-like metal-dependent hydrolase (beta-lactamase superfamily II)
MGEEHDLIQLAQHVWIYPHHKGIQPNVGIITTETQTILIDSGNSLKHAQNIETSLMKIGAPPVKYIIYTHHHWDHTFGGSHFNGTFISHELCYNYLIEYSQIKWCNELLEEEIKRNPLLEGSHRAKMELIDDWNAFNIKLPQITFKKELSLYLDGITLELKHIGGIHANDSVTVKVLEADILFLGDCFYPPSIQYRREGDTYSLDILKTIHQESASLYIHGHGEPAKHKRLGEFIGFLEQENN